MLQFNAYTNRSEYLEHDTTLRGSAQFSAAAKISNGDKVKISFNGESIERVFALDPELKGTIALNPTFDNVADASSYKFLKSKIMRVV